MSIPCESAKQIERLEHAIYGNGKPGLLTRISNIENMNDDIKSMQADVKVLLMFQAQTLTRDEVIKEYKETHRWLVGTLIGLCALFVSAIVYLV